MLLFDVVGSELKVVPEHTGLTDENEGVTFGLTVIVKVVVFAHWPKVGVNVYVVVFVLSNVGDQVPVMLLIDVVGKALNVAPEHIGLIEVKVGVAFCTIVTANKLAWLVPQAFFAWTRILPVIELFEAVMLIVFEVLEPVKPEGKVHT